MRTGGRRGCVAALLLAAACAAGAQQAEQAVPSGEAGAAANPAAATAELPPPGSLPGDLPAGWPEEPAAALPVAAPPSAAEQVELQRGIASWYGPRFHGRRTASGERFDMHALTAAHPTLPFGTIVRVESLVNGRQVEVRINDRGPHLKQRIIDLSRGAAAALGLLEAGTGTKPVVLKLIRPSR